MKRNHFYICLIISLFSINCSLYAQCKFIEISRGLLHSLAIAPDGTLWAWGDNSMGQLGDSTFQSSQNPKKINSDTNWKYVCAGNSHSMAIKRDGSLWAWGLNNLGQLGLGHSVTISIPERVGSAFWNSISTWTTQTYGIKLDGSLWTWGGGQIPQLFSSQKWKQVKVSKDVQSIFRTNLGINMNGTLWSWGGNKSGLLGIGIERDTIINNPVQIGNNNDWAFITNTINHAAAIKKDSSLWSWGDNKNGALGNSPFFTNRSKPTEYISNLKWTNIHLTDNSTFAIDKDKGLWVAGELIDKVFVGSNLERVNYFIQVGNQNNWVDISSSYDSYNAIRSDSSLWRWNGFGLPKNNCCSQSFSSFDIKLCLNDTIQINNLELYPGASNITDTLINIDGCDSIVLYNITSFPSDTSFSYDTLCHEETRFIYGKLFNKNSPIHQIVLANADQNNCDSLIFYNIHFLDSLFIGENISYANGSINIDLEIYGGFPPYSYKWNTGDTSKNISIMHDGLFTVSVVDRNNCTTLKIYNLKTLFDNYIKNNKVEILRYNNHFLVNSQNLEIKEYQIFDLSGRLINKVMSNSQTIQVNIFDLPAGLSICRLLLSDGSYEILKLF